MSFLSKRTMSRHKQVVRVEGVADPTEASDGDPVAMVRFDNYNANNDTAATAIEPLGDIAAFRTDSEPPDGRMEIRPYAKGVPSTSTGVSVLSDGRVGIGVQNPAYRLDVAGDVRCTSLYAQNGFRVGNNDTSIGADIDIAGDVLCRRVWMRRLVSSAFASAVGRIADPVAFPSAGWTPGADVSVSGTATHGVISMVFPPSNVERERVLIATRGLAMIAIARVVMPQPMPCAVCLTAFDDAAAGLCHDVYALPTIVGFEVVISRRALSRFSNGMLYRWSFVAAGLPRPPMTPRPEPAFSTTPIPTSPAVTPGADLPFDCLVRAVGTDDAGLIRVAMRTTPMPRRDDSHGAYHIATVTFATKLESGSAGVVLVAPWSRSAIASAVGAGIRRKPGSAAGIVRSDGTSFDLFLGCIDSRDHLPYTTYTWSYFLRRADEGPDQEKIDAMARARAQPEAAAGESSLAEAKAIGDGLGTVTLVTGDVNELDGQRATVPIVTAFDLHGVGSGSPVVICAANTAAASIVRSVSVQLVGPRSFSIRIATSPPSPPLWPHTRYIWTFASDGTNRPPPTTPLVWVGKGLTSGDAVRLIGTDVCGRIDIAFGPRAARRPVRRRHGAHIATVVFSVRYEEPVSVVLTCASDTAVDVPTLVAYPRPDHAGFEVYASAKGHGRILPYTSWSWSYTAMGASLKRR